MKAPAPAEVGPTFVFLSYFLPATDLYVTEGWCERKLNKAGDPSELVDLLPLAQLASVATRAGGQANPLRQHAGIVHTDGHHIATTSRPLSSI